ncbi:unannotated protein [freshwater metagenome]|uniref:Unannotated protein n=1 Tax=freshwater metagenome TaxID=449393 RepID=A0A6J6YHP8_9ZZZZ
MQIPVEDSIHHAALGKAGHADPNHFMRIDSGGLHRLQIVKTKPRKALHD